MHTTHGSKYNVCSFIVQVSSVNRIPKPKPKVEKKTAKEEEPASKEKTTSSESAPNEGEYTEMSQESKRISLHQPTLAIQNLNLMTSCEYQNP